MRNKTVLVMLCILLLLNCSINVAAIQINNKEQNNENDVLDSSRILKTEDIDLEGDDKEVHWETGLVKFRTRGKGLLLIVPLKILRINIPLITPQYDRFLPIRVDNFVTLLVYNDENASTIIEQKGKETIYINGSHSIMIGMFKMQYLHLIRLLLQDGIFDGFQRLQDKGKGPLASIFYKLITNVFGGPLINISSETYELLDFLKGSPPRYDLSPIFNISLINDINEKLPLNGFYLRYFGYMFPSQLFWNRMPVRMNLLQLEKTMRCHGYSPFIRWTKTPKLQPMVQTLQDLIPNIIYDEPVEWKEY